MKLCLHETEKSAKEQIHDLQRQLSEISEQHSKTLKACQIKAETQCNELETKLKLSHDREAELVESLNHFTVTENRLRDKVQASEQEFAERLQAATTRERDLNDKIAQLTRQLQNEENRRCEHEERLKLNELRQRQHSSGKCVINGNDTLASVQYTSPTGNKSQMLEEEVESLRSVLELKQNEIAELRKQNHELQSAHDELPKALTKISVMETRLEDLTIQYQIKVEEEK